MTKAIFEKIIFSVNSEIAINYAHSKEYLLKRAKSDKKFLSLLSHLKKDKLPKHIFTYQKRVRLSPILQYISMSYQQVVSQKVP